MKKNYYDILGVDKNASQDAIKKAFRKLSLKWHPDRQSGKSGKERKEAEEKFKEIGEAYETLSDPQKRKRYDNPGFSGFKDFFGGGFHHTWNGWNTTADWAKTIQPGSNCTATLNLNIEDFYNRGKKKVVFIKQFRCKTCNGAGGEGVKTCPHCNGTRIITETNQQGNMFFQNTYPCPYCSGTGKIVEHRCADCSGTGLIGKLYEETIDLSELEIWHIIKDGINLNFNGKGSESKDKDGPNGNLIVTVNHEYDHNIYNINGETGDVEQKLYIDWKDVLLGDKVVLDMPGGHKMKVTIPECCEIGKKLRLGGKGINGADYYICVIPKFPEKLTDKEKELILKLKQ